MERERRPRKRVRPAKDTKAQPSIKGNGSKSTIRSTAKSPRAKTSPSASKNGKTPDTTIRNEKPAQEKKIANATAKKRTTAASKATAKKRAPVSLKATEKIQTPAVSKATEKTPPPVSPKGPPKAKPRPLSPDDVQIKKLADVSATLERDLKETRELATLLREIKVTGEPTPPRSLEADLDHVSRSFRRTLVDVLDRQSDRISNPLTGISRSLDRISKRCLENHPDLASELEGCVSNLGTVFEELGVEKFEADAQEIFDPLIHQMVGSEDDEKTPHGHVIRGVSSGFRAANGRILMPAQVIVNRR